MKNRIKELRLSKRLSQSEIAKIIGVSQSQYAKYENGVHEWKLTDTSWTELAKYFNVDVGYLMGLTEDDEMVTTLTEGGFYATKIDKNIEDRKEIALSMSQADEVIGFLEEKDHYKKNDREQVNAFYLIMKEFLKTQNK